MAKAVLTREEQLAKFTKPNARKYKAMYLDLLDLADELYPIETNESDENICRDAIRFTAFKCAKKASELQFRR